MTFERLVLHNFGGYYGEHVFALDKARPGRPIILVGGLNGAGKSTLMDAVQLALFGKLAQCTGRGPLGYEEFLRRCTHRSALPPESRVLLEFRYRVSGEEHQYRLDRSWVCNDRGVREHFEVWKNGRLDKALAESWQDQMEQWLPAGLSQLFFFDGERIEALADLAMAATVLRESVSALLGLDLIARLAADLSLLSKQKEALLVGAQVPEALAEVQNRARELQARHEALTQEIGTITTYEVERRQRELRELETTLLQQGGSQFDHRRDLETRHASVKHQLASVEEQLRDLASGAAPLLVVWQALDDIAGQVHRESQRRESELLDAHLASRDAEVLSRLRSRGVLLPELEILDSVLTEDRQQRCSIVGVDTYIHMSEEGQESLRALRQVILSEIQERTSTLLVQCSQLQSQAETLTRQLSAIPSEESMAPLVERRHDLRAQLSEATTRRDEKVRERDRVQLDLERCQKELERQTYAILESRFEADNSVRILKHIDRVKDTLSTFREALLRKHISTIEQLTLESLRHLLRKKQLVTGLSIDAKTFSVSLRTVGDSPLPTDRLSAGERQLLATALLWGLRRASGRVVPLVIDTPLGRLDSTHRKHLVERYFPHASHQVILLSTDEEIDQRYFKALKPVIASAYTLVVDEARDSTRIEPGYFQNHWSTRDVS